MTDLHRRDALRLFLPAIAAEPEPAFRDAYLRRLATLTETPEAELRRALLRAPGREDRAALAVLSTLTPARSVQP